MFRSFAKNPGVRLALSKRSYSSMTSYRVPLAFDLHAATPAKSDSPIIFMHGLFGSKKNNRSISKALARDLNRDVYCLDLRNHGDSGHDKRHDYLAMADDVVGWIEEESKKKPLSDPTLIGHSMGAKVAMTIALQSPESIQNFVSVDNAPIDAALQSNFGKYVQGMKKIEKANVTTQKQADQILEEYEKDIGIRQFLLGNLHRPDDDKEHLKFKIPLKILEPALNGMGDFPFSDPNAVRFNKPALFVRGTKSHYVPDEALPIIGRFFPRFELADINAGHWLISEQPEAFRKAVVEFLKPKDE